MNEKAKKPKKAKRPGDRRGGARAGAGRKPKPYSITLLDQAASSLCTYDEICGLLGISKSTLQEIFARDPRAREIYDAGTAKGRALLKMAQMQSALNGNATMLIFLGKNVLGQSNESVLRVNADSVTKEEKAVVPDWLKDALQVQARAQVIDVEATDGTTNLSPVNGNSMLISGQSIKATVDQ